MANGLKKSGGHGGVDPPADSVAVARSYVTAHVVLDRQDLRVDTSPAGPRSLTSEANSNRLRRARHSAFSRMAKNVTWVASSRGFNSVVSVAYLAVAARALGPASFGVFALILTYAQLIANFVQFQSWKGVIRYGALHVAAVRPDRLQRLFGFTATLDFASAIVGALIAVAGVPLIGPLLQWAPQDQTSAAAFAGVLLLTTGATPTGILRLFGRFDLAAFGEAIGPLARLVGAVAAWAAGAGVLGFLVVCAIAGVAQAVSQWIAVVFVNRSRLAFGRREFKMALEENHRLWAFMLQTNISNSVTMFWTQLGTLAVGAFAGPVEAGGFRLAQRLAKGILRPVQPVILAIYPELTRLVAEDGRREMRIVVIRVTLVAAVLALAVVLVTSFAGRQIIHIFAGRHYEFARKFLFLLSIAAAIDLVGFVFEPLQNAHGHSWNVLRSKLIGAGVYAVLVVILLPLTGGQGAAIAAIICSTVIFLQLAFFTAKLLGGQEVSAKPTAEDPLAPTLS